MGGADRSGCCALDSFEKEVDPGLPVPVLSHAVQQLVVSAAVRFEEQAQVEQWLLQNPYINQHQHDQESTHATVANENRMDRLELHVGQCGADQQRQAVFALGTPMDELLQLPHSIRQPR